MNGKAKHQDDQVKNRKICIITGANSGIGRQAAVQMAQKGAHAILACRNAERGEEALAELKRNQPACSAELRLVDMGNLASVRQFAKEIKQDYERIDVMIHNAAIFNITQKHRIETEEKIENIWATNHIGPVLLTELLLDQLKNSPDGRVITIASKGLLAKPFLKVDLEDPEFHTKKFHVVNAYYQSKLAQIMYTYWLSDRLKDTTVTVNCIRVPAVKLDIARHPELSNFMKWVYKQKAKQSITPQKMAETYIWASLDSRQKHVTGRYFDENNLEVSSGKYTRNESNINDMMNLTKSYIPELEGVV